MQRTINHTGRERIERKDVQITVKGNDPEPPSFDAEFHFARKSYPDSAAIYVEAYQRNTLQRFDFGTVADMRQPSLCVLDQIDLSGPTLFRVRVVDETGSVGRLIATVDGLRPQGEHEEETKSSLIVVRQRPLGEQTWRVEFETSGKPELCVNSSIPDAIGQVKNNPVFQALILPAVFRQVLMYFLWNDEDDNECADQWFRFAELIHAERPHTNDPSQLVAWVDEVVDEFSRRFGLCSLLKLKMEQAD